MLVPGMPVEAYLTTGERSPAAYLLKPLADYFSTAFREHFNLGRRSVQLFQLDQPV